MTREFLIISKFQMIVWLIDSLTRLRLFVSVFSISFCSVTYVLRCAVMHSSAAWLFVVCLYVCACACVCVCVCVKRSRWNYGNMCMHLCMYVCMCLSARLCSLHESDWLYVDVSNCVPVRVCACVCRFYRSLAPMVEPFIKWTLSAATPSYDCSSLISISFFILFRRTE